MSEGRKERRVLGRYLLANAIASGGMATIHIGRLLGPVGFARTVAIKRLHPQYAKDPEFVAMFLDEARLAARIQHPNVVSTLDVVALEGELFLVLEYVEGESLSRLLRRTQKADQLIPPRIASGIVANALWGLHAAHEARGDGDEPLNLVHRDVSPHNILVGVDGVARVADFGVAKASRRVQRTETGQVKGKISYMAPEQLGGKPVDRRSDVFAAGLVLWEALTARRLLDDDDPTNILERLRAFEFVPPSRYASVGANVDAVVQRALASDPKARFQTAREMAIALEDALPPALPREIGEWVERTAGDVLERRANALSELQREASSPSASDDFGLVARELGSNDATQSLGPARPSASESGDDTATTAVLGRPGPDATVASFDASPEPPPRRGPMPPLVIGSVLGGMLFVALVLAFVVLRRSSPVGHDVAATSATASVALPEASTAPSGEPSIAPSGTPSAPPTAPETETTDAALPATKHVKPKPAVTPRPNCNPPYWVDSAGIKKYKPECLPGK